MDYMQFKSDTNKNSSPQSWLILLYVQIILLNQTEEITLWKYVIPDKLLNTLCDIQKGTISIWK